MQCYGSTGYCWCVDVGGNPVEGTMSRGLPHCNKIALGGATVQHLITIERFRCTDIFRARLNNEQPIKWYKNVQHFCNVC